MCGLVPANVCAVLLMNVYCGLVPENVRAVVFLNVRGLAPESASD